MTQHRSHLRACWNPQRFWFDGTGDQRDPEMHRAHALRNTNFETVANSTCMRWWKIRGLVIFNVQQAKETCSGWGKVLVVPVLLEAWSWRQEPLGAGRSSLSWKPAPDFAFFFLALSACLEADKVRPAGSGFRCLSSVLSHPSFLWSSAPWSLLLSRALQIWTSESWHELVNLATYPRPLDSIGLGRGPDFAFVISFQVILKLLAGGLCWGRANKFARESQPGTQGAEQ